MRIATHSNPFHRPSKNKENEVEDFRKKYYVALEGEVTEHIYFKAFLKSLTNQSILFLKQGSSNPKSILDELLKKMELVEPFSIQRNEIVETILESFETSFAMVSKSEIQRITNSIVSKYHWDNKIEFDANEYSLIVREVCESIPLDSFPSENFVSHINQVLKERTEFDSKLDGIILIVDRDRKSFTEEQYDSVLSDCMRYHVHLFVTNPCIEFWFLLHFSDCKGIEKQLLNNGINEKGQTFAYQQLKLVDPSYSKKHVDAQQYLRLYNTALKHSKRFPSDLKKLKNEIGTNIPELKSLIQKIKN